MDEVKAKIKIETAGIEKIEKATRILRERAVNTRPLMQRLGAAMVGIVDRNFEAEGRPQKWKKRSPITQATLSASGMIEKSYTKRYQNAKKLSTKVRYLRAASNKARDTKILSSSHSQLKNSIKYDADLDTVKVGSSGAVPYARIHQFGGIIRPKKAKALIVPYGYGRVLRLQKVTIPARPYLIVPSSEIGTLEEEVGKFLDMGGLRL